MRWLTLLLPLLLWPQAARPADDAERARLAAERQALLAEVAAVVRACAQAGAAMQGCDLSRAECLLKFARQERAKQVVVAVPPVIFIQRLDEQAIAFQLVQHGLAIRGRCRFGRIAGIQRLTQGGCQLAQQRRAHEKVAHVSRLHGKHLVGCLLYTSDAADE